METIAFKPYPCGTMTQPYIDCAIELGESGVAAESIAEIVCEVGEGTVHRLWEPLADKQRPPNAYAGKFSTPYCMAVAFFDRRVGFAQFAADRLTDPAVLGLAGKIRYVIDPHNEYPRNFTGHLRATLKDGSVREYPPALYAGRRTRPTLFGRDPRQIPRQCRLWRAFARTRRRRRSPRSAAALSALPKRRGSKGSALGGGSRGGAPLVLATVGTAYFGSVRPAGRRRGRARARRPRRLP